MMASCPGPGTAKQAQIIMFPPPYFIVGIMCWSWHAVVFLCLLVPPKEFCFKSLHKTFPQYHCGASRCSFANFRHAAMFLFDSSGLLLGVLPWTMYLFLPWTCIVEPWTEVLASSNYFFKSFAVTLGFFFTSLMTLHCAPGVILGATIPNCLHL